MKDEHPSEAKDYKSDERKHYLELYKQFRKEVSFNSSLHYQHFQRYLTLITALFAAMLIGLYRAEEGSRLLMVGALMAGTLNLGICYLARRICDNHYQGTMEMVVASAKMEALLGLTGKRPESECNRGAFPDDFSILPERWITQRDTFSSSEAFINDRMNKSSNRIIRQTLGLLAFANVSAILGFVLYKCCF